jgi:hypothetical protein
MITIRKVQIDVLGEYMRKSFELNSIKLLKLKYHEETINKNEEEMLKFVREGIEKATNFKIIERNDVFSFLEYMICFGNNFFSNPANEWAIKVFRIRNLPGDERIIRLKKYQPLKSDIE